MSLTSYRAAPPRGGEGCWAPAGVYPGLDPGPGRCSTSALAGLAGLALRRLCGPGLGRVSGGFGRPGGDLLFRALRRSTIGAEGFHGRVRDGIGCLAPRYGHQAVQSHRERPRALRAAGRTVPRRKPGPILRRAKAGRSELRVSPEG